MSTNHKLSSFFFFYWPLFIWLKKREVILERVEVHDQVAHGAEMGTNLFIDHIPEGRL